MDYDQIMKLLTVLQSQPAIHSQALKDLIWDELTNNQDWTADELRYIIGFLLAPIILIP